MNILVLCLSTGKGGLELYAQRELRWLRNSGHDCYAAVSRGSIFLEKGSRCVLEYSEIKRSSRLFPFMAAYRVAKIIDRYKIDVLHIHWAKDLNLAVFSKLLSRRDVRLVYTRHMGITRQKKDFYHRFLYRGVNKLIVGTKLVYDEAIRYLPLKENIIEQLYIGVPSVSADHDKYKIIIENSRIRDRKFKIGLFGRIEQGKGQEVLVHAVEDLVERGHDVGAAIIGHIMDDSYFSNLRDHIESSKLSDYIQFFGYMEKPDSIMACFDVIVLTTYCETFGLVLVEAMMAGVSVIGTDAGGVPEIIENGVNGILFKPGSSSELAEAIEKLIVDVSYRSNLASAGKERADLLFSEDTHFHKLETILSSVIAH